MRPTARFTVRPKTIYAGHGDASGHQQSADFWGGHDRHDNFVFQPGTSQVVMHDFDQHGGGTFKPAQGDLIDVSAYHLGGMQNLSITETANPNYPNGVVTVITLPPTANHLSQINLLGVHAQELIDNSGTVFHF